MSASDQRQTCKVCGRPEKFNFHVPDAVWEAVVPDRYRQLVVCLYCFDSFANERDVTYATSLETLYFAGDRGVLAFSPRVIAA
jgi:hypothetical protein